MKKRPELTGRPPKLNPRSHRLTVRFDDEEYAKFLSMYHQSGCYAKAVFLKEMVFGKTFKVILPSTDPYGHYAKLTNLHAKFRQIGVDYNLTVKEMKYKFSENKTIALLHRLEQYTKEMTAICREMVALTNDFERRNSNYKH